MAILWCGCEELDFPLGTQFVAIGWYRSGYGRTGLHHHTNGAKCYSKPITPFTDCWLSAWWKQPGYSGYYGSSPIIGLTNSQHPGEGIWLRNMGVICRIANGQVDLFSGLPFRVSGFIKFDMQISNFGSNGTINVWLNGGRWGPWTYTGDLGNAGHLTNLDQVALGASNNASDDMYQTGWTEIILADEDTRAFNLVTHYPTGAGDSNAWTGAYTDIDETTLSDADMLQTNAADTDGLFAVSNCPAGAFDVPAVKIIARTIKAGSPVAASKLKLGVKSGGTVDLDAGQTPPFIFADFGLERMMTQINGGAITTSVLDGMQLDLKSAT